MKNTIKLIIFTLSLSMLHLAAAAQARRVTGTVADEKGAPITGATIKVEGTNVATVSAQSGAFSINVPDGKNTLAVSSMGYSDKTVNVENLTTVKVTLSDASKEMEELVVVGYGMMRKSDITGSVSSVKINDEEAARATSLDKLLQGAAAGIQVTSTSFAPGAAIDIRIRGNSSFNMSGQPLYVVDGVMLNPPSQGDGTLITGGSNNASTDQSTNGLMGINPQDIASMEILKDASATAIYGSFGANGVVLITTKTGTGSRPTISFRTGMDFSTPSKRLPMMNLSEYSDYLAATGTNTQLNKIYVDPNDRSLGLKPGVQEVDWQDYAMRTAINQRYRLQLAGKNETTSYLIAAGYLKSQGIIRNTDASQFDARVNLDKNVTKKLKLGMRINVAQIQLHMTQGTDAGNLSSASSMIRSMLISKPWYNFNDSQAVLDDPDMFGEQDEDVLTGVPLWLKDFNDHSIEYRVTPNIYGELNLAKWLTYKLSIGGDYRNKQHDKWKGPLVNNDPMYKGIGAIANQRALRVTMDNMLMFNKGFGRHNISGTVGTTFTNSTNTIPTISSWYIDQYVPQVDNINTGSTGVYRYDETKSATLSYLARAVYSYNNRYILTATYRADASSKFKAENKWAYFPSFALAWRATEEKWFTLPKTSISSLKLRLGWGRVGNEGLSPYQTFANYGKNTYSVHNNIDSYDSSGSGYLIGVAPTNVPNELLKWETTETYNAGIDLGIFNDRINITVDAYNKLTKDLLQTALISATTGHKDMWDNRGTIRNRGIEFTVDANVISKKDFYWRLGGVASINRNKIIDIGVKTTDGAKPIYYGDTPLTAGRFEGEVVGSSNYVKNPINIFIEGMPIGMFYGYKTDGIVQIGETGPNTTDPFGAGPGSIKYVLAPDNTTGLLSPNDRQILGNPNPDLVYGFNTSLGYKNLSLSLNFNGVYGIDVANINRAVEEDANHKTKNMRRAAYFGAWTPENPTNRYPSLTALTSADLQYFADRLIEDGSYLRLSNITLSYNIPFKNPHYIRSLEVSFMVGNAWIWTNYSGWDPEVKSFGSNIKRMGADSGSYPNSRTYSFGLNFNF